MFCTACGTRNSSDANYCKQCGGKIEKAGSPAISEEAFALPESPDERVKDRLLCAFQKNASGDHEAALQACAEALELRPDSTDAHSLMSTLYEKQGDMAKAIAERERVLELNPGSIADREKLEQLRDSTTRITPRKITSRRLAVPTLFDTPAGAAVVAVGVMAFVLLIGAWILWRQNDRSQAAPLAGPPSTVAAPSTVAQNPMPMQTAPTVPWTSPYGGYVFQSPGATTPAPGTQAGPPRRPRPSFDTSQMQPVRPIPPAAVSMPSQEQLERDPRFSGQSGNQNNGNRETVHLPDAAPGTNEAGPGPASSGSGGEVATPPRPNPGRIEIVVSSDGSRGGGTASPPQTPAGDGNSPTLDSRQQRDYARQLQMQGQYRRAITSYVKALDGAGDEAASIHQQIALCYQRLDDKDSAVTSYNTAIAEYRKQIQAGRNVDAANRGIRACEAGIRACQ